MAKRQTTEESPVNGLFPTTKSNGTSLATLEKEQQAPIMSLKPSKKQRITVQISADVIDRIKNAVYWTPGLTLAFLAEEAFSKAVDELENYREAPFPKRKEELKTGRPIK